jgi:eukaryotic-like serine/threonine-protein kinase
VPGPRRNEDPPAYPTAARFAALRRSASGDTLPPPIRDVPSGAFRRDESPVEVVSERRLSAAKPAPVTTPPVPSEGRETERQPLFPIGELIDGNYEVRALLGEGGMGQVLEAYDHALRRYVALKASWPHLDGAALRREARSLAAVRHPGVVGVYGVGEHRGMPYVVLERVFGDDLQSVIDAYARRREDVPVNDALALLVQLADGLAAVHGVGLAHRDVKPSNVMLARGGRVVLTDFGLAATDEDSEPMIGTPAYMAPEAIADKIDAHEAFFLDIYALGVVAYQLLSGHPPFVGDRAHVVALQLGTVAPDLRTLRAGIPASLALLVDEMLARDPHARPPTMQAVAWRLRGVRRDG